MNDVPIFKIYKMIGNDNVDEIYIFNKLFKTYRHNELEQMFKSNPTEGIFANTFTQSEIYKINEKNINLKFVSDYIYIDDSIGIIKLKIFKALNEKVSADEMHLYCLIKDNVNLVPAA